MTTRIGRRPTRDRPDVREGEARAAPERDLTAEREERRFGGTKIGSAFFGWLTATGMALLLIALISAAGAAVGLGTETNVGDAANQAVQNPATVGLIGAIALLVIVFVSYYAGGYVAGRMARFNGVRQGVAVWVWAVVIAVAVAILGAIAGNQYDIFARLNGVPRIPVNEGAVTAGGIFALLAIGAASLAGAMLGGKAGTRYHRKVDRAGSPMQSGRQPAASGAGR